MPARSARPLPGVSGRISDGELEISSPAVGGGEAWHPTGDLAEEVGDDRIRVRGRREDVIARAARASSWWPGSRPRSARAPTSGARWSPLLGGSELTAIVEVDYDETLPWATERDLHFSHLRLAGVGDEVAELVAAEVAAANERLGSSAEIAEFIVLPRQLSDPRRRADAGAGDPAPRGDRPLHGRPGGQARPGRAARQGVHPVVNVSVITGGAGGMGVATASRLADRGPILLADVSDERLEAAAAQLGAADVHLAVCDVTDPASVESLARRARELGPLGALVHTAGIAPPGAKDTRLVLDVNLAGTARVLDAFLPLAGPGTVAVCIASLAGHRSFTASFEDLLAHPLDPDLHAKLSSRGVAVDDVLATYSLSKRGVILEVRRRAAAWGAQGARIVSVSPGLIADTELGREAAGIHAGAYVQQSALQRAGTAADIAGVVAFLVSADTAYVTGCDLLVDGGVVAHTLVHADPAARDAWNSASYVPKSS